MANFGWGFDLTGFSSAQDFAQLLKRNGISTKPTRYKPDTKAHLGGVDPNYKSGWHWKGKGILMVTSNNPLTGRRYDGNDASWGIRKGYAGYIGIEGDEKKVRALAADIKKTTYDIKDESKGARDFI